MKKISQVLMAIALSTVMLSYGCAPNDDKGSMDEKNSNKEGAIDTTKIPNFDSAHASLSVRHLTGHSL